MLTEWVRANHPDGSHPDARWVRLRLDAAESLDTPEIRRALDDAPGRTMVVPVRLGWAPDRGTEDSKPRLRDLVLGDPARPRNQFARMLRRSDPARARYLVGEGATVGDLRKRYADRFDGAGAGQDGGGQDGVRELYASGEPFGSFVARQADLALDVAERGLRGRRYKVPRFVVPGIEAGAGYRRAVADAARTLGTSTGEVAAEARGYLDELVATPTTFFIDWMGTLTRWITSLGYKRVVTDPENVERARAMVRDHPSALLWTHKSHIDAIALMSVMYDNDFPAPHSIGGINMAFTGVGYAGRRSGTIFIRRTFNDNPVYKLALRQYLGFLMAKRFPLSWSFEGTRSRTGTLGRPRFGLLKYAIDAAHATDTEDLHLIPVSINYDLIGETADYAREESGSDKQAESLGWFIEYLRRLRAPMGNIYLDFGEPVVLAGRAPEPTRELLGQVSFDVARRAGACVPVTMASLLCMVLLGTQPRALTREEIDTAMREIVRWLQSRGVRLEDTLAHGDLHSGEALFNHALGTGVLRTTSEASVELIGIGRGQDLVASYYRNTIVHYFIEKAIAELSLSRVADRAPGTRAQAFREEIETLRAMLRSTFFLPPAEEFHDAVDRVLTSYDAGWAATLDGGPDAATGLLAEFRPLVAHSTLLPFIEARWIVATVVAGFAPGDDPDRQEIIGKALRYGRSAMERRLIVGGSAVSKAMLDGGYDYLAALGLVGHDCEDFGSESIVARRRAVRSQLETVLEAIDAIRERAHRQLFGD